MRSDWIFRIIDSNDNYVHLLQAKKRSVSIGLNKAGEASFEIDLTDAKATDNNLKIGVNTLEVLRNDTTFFKGQLMIVQKILDEINRNAECKALGWLYLLDKRFAGLSTDREFTDTDAGEIAWTLIDESQQETYGDLGITEGSIETSQNLTMTYSRANIKTAIEDLTRLAGFDFEISNDKAFNVYYPIKGTDRSSTVVFRYPGAIKRIRQVRDSTTIVNYELALGKGWGDQELTATGEDVTSESIYYRREAVESYKDIFNATSLANIASYDVSQLRSPSEVYEIDLHGNNEVPDLDDYQLGDIITVKSNDSYWSFEKTFRIFEIHVDIDENDKENIKLIVG